MKIIVTTLSLLALLFSFLTYASEPSHFHMEVDQSIEVEDSIYFANKLQSIDNKIQSSVYFEEFMLIAQELAQLLREGDQDQFLRGCPR